MYTLMRKNLIHCPAIVYIQGEEMTRHVMKTFIDKCIQPHVDTSSWDFFDMSCKNRDKTKDKVLHDAILRGNELCSIFKEPTVTPSLIQKEKYIDAVIGPQSYHKLNDTILKIERNSKKRENIWSKCRTSF